MAGWKLAYLFIIAVLLFNKTVFAENLCRIRVCAIPTWLLRFLDTNATSAWGRICLTGSLRVDARSEKPADCTRVRTVVDMMQPKRSLQIWRHGATKWHYRQHWPHTSRRIIFSSVSTQGGKSFVTNAVYCSLKQKHHGWKSLLELAVGRSPGDLPILLVQHDLEGN